jgi:predicted ATPase
MLTRLEVKGFKNLIDVDVRFGPLTCVAGPNGVGKSNLFDAIIFLKALADFPFIEAASLVRGGKDIDSLFSAQGDGTMTLLAEMLIPKVGIDDFGQRAEASTTFVRYTIALKRKQSKEPRLREDIELIKEELSYITKEAAARSFAFRHCSSWRRSVLHTDRRAPYITTDSARGIIKRHQDRRREEGVKKRGGASWEFPLANLPRSVLSSAQNAKESPTAVLVRQEMRRWRLLQLEPSALRSADDIRAPNRLEPSGAHMPATLFRLANNPPEYEPNQEAWKERIYASVANRLAELVEGIGKVRIHHDMIQKLLTIKMMDLHGIELPAGSLSDGTLRFLALTILELDPEDTGLLCLEEPENGIHPERIDSMLTLLKDIAVDVNEPIGLDNPLRQVIINTHSPAVVGLVEDESLLFAQVYSQPAGQAASSGLELRCMENTVRAKKFKMKTLGRGQIIDYLAGNLYKEDKRISRTRPRRVIDRYKDQLQLPYRLE